MLLLGTSAAIADSGPHGDVAAIRKVLTHGGKCPQSVLNVAVSGAYALATTLQRGACDVGFVTVLKRNGSTWKMTGGVGGVPDACTVHSQGVPLTVASTLVRKLTGTNNPSLVSTSACK